MKLDKAIEILENMRDTNLNYYSPDRSAALQLGIEALKLIQRERLLGINPVETKLPGETTEEEAKRR